MAETATDMTEPQLMPQVMVEAARALDMEVDRLRFDRIAGDSPLPDSPTKIVIRDDVGRPLAVAMCATRTAPDLVARAVDAAEQFASALAPAEAAAVLLPLAAGAADGISIAIYPWRRPLETSRLRRWLNRRALRLPLLAWLRRVTEQTVQPVADHDVQSLIAAPLRTLTTDRRLPFMIRLAARSALARLERAAWKPMHVGMHGDFWYGNILIDESREPHRPWNHRFVIIDWPDARLRGWPLYDLMRIAVSLGLPARTLAAEIDQHCAILGGDRRDAPHHLIASLACLADCLTHFPPERFAAMAGELFQALAPLMKER